jgi:hypothetical protein
VTDDSQAWLALLSRVNVVRITPADVLVLSGVQRDDVDGGRVGRLSDSLQEMGVQYRGLVLLEPGITVDGIDLEALLARDLAAQDAAVGDSEPGALNTGFGAAVACPRCDTQVPLRVGLTITNDLRARSFLDRTALVEHARECFGADHDGR